MSKIIKALIKKELEHIKQDRSILIIAFILPLILIFIYGYGLNLDINNIKIALSCKQNDSNCSQLYYQLQGSEYFEITQITPYSQAQSAFNQDLVAAVIFIDEHNRHLIYINAASSQKGFIIENYIKTALNLYYAKLNNTQAINIVVHNRYNEANLSAYFLIPGQLVGIITLISTFMSSLLIAREYDRNTILFLKSANLKASDIIIAKLIPYFIISFLGSLLCILIALILFELPFRGSILIFIISLIIYVFMANCLGLLISVIVKNQFLASEYAIIISLLPSLLLSGAIFDLKAAASPIYYLSYLIPPRYAVSAIKMCFLSDANYLTILFNDFILLIVSAIFLAICNRQLHKDLH